MIGPAAGPVDAARTSPARVLVTGDLHANTAAAFEVVDHASRLGADLVLQVGDLGWFPRDQRGQVFIRKLEKRLTLRGLNMWWIDGNHEDHDRLSARSVGVEGRRQVTEHMWHLPRGFRWTWHHAVWVAAGGAVSVDKAFRTEGKTWFPTEELTDDEVERIISDGPADVVVSHDAPLGVPTLRALLNQDRPAWRRVSVWPTGQVLRSDEHQRRLRRLVEGVEAKRVLHGHHHLRYSDVLSAIHGPVLVEGLGMDLDPIASRCLLVDGDGHPITAESPHHETGDG